MRTVSINDSRPRTITYKTDISGQIFHRQEGDNNASQQDPQEVWYRFGGKQTGYTGNNGTSDKDYMASIADRQAAAASTSNGPFRNGATTATAYADFDQSLAAAETSCLKTKPPARAVSALWRTRSPRCAPSCSRSTWNIRVRQCPGSTWTM